MRVCTLLKFVAVPLVVWASPASLMAQMTTPEMPGMPPEVPTAPRPGEGQPMPPPPGIPAPPDNPTSPQPLPETPTPPTIPETPVPATPTVPADPSNPAMPSSPPPSGGGAMAQGNIRWAPLFQIPAPAPQADYPPCTREVQDQCSNTRKGTDMPKAKRSPRG
jgi:hypothetical protein